MKTPERKKKCHKDYKTSIIKTLPGPLMPLGANPVYIPKHPGLGVRWRLTNRSLILTGEKFMGWGTQGTLPMGDIVVSTRDWEEEGEGGQRTWWYNKRFAVTDVTLFSRN